MTCFVTLAVITEIWPVAILSIISLKELYFWLFLPHRCIISIEIDNDDISIECANGAKNSISTVDLDYTKDNGKVMFLTLKGIKYPLSFQGKKIKNITKHLDLVCKERI